MAYALLMSRDEAVQKSQLGRLQHHADPGVLTEFHKIHLAVAGLARAAYLPLVDLSVPALRGLSANQYRDFRENL